MTSTCRARASALVLFLCATIVSSGFAWAQTGGAPTLVVPGADDSDIQGVEKQLGGDKDELVPAVKTTPIKTPAVVDFRELNQSKNAQELVVIQRNYMPKSERFQAFGGLTMVATDVFYRTLGLQGRLAYHFNETWGAEVMGFYLGSVKSEDLKEMEGSPNNTTATALVSPRSYIGLDAYFNAIYGKMALYDRKIIPFEVYQTFGIGKMSTAQTNGADAFHVGLGEIFSVSRSSALRVDLSVIVYRSQNIRNETQTNNSLFLTIGYGRFFPEAQYR